MNNNDDELIFAYTHTNGKTYNVKLVSKNNTGTEKYISFTSAMKPSTLPKNQSHMGPYTKNQLEKMKMLGKLVLKGGKRKTRKSCRKNRKSTRKNSRR
jgi:hypothetical protein